MKMNRNLRHVLPVGHWEKHADGVCPHATHIIEAIESPEFGYMYLTIAPNSGKTEEMLPVIGMVDTDPLSQEEVPALQVDFDTDNVAFKIFKVNDQYVLQLADGVSLTNTDKGMFIIK